MYDIIGHIGGNAPALHRLLNVLGYEPRGNTHIHGTRRAIFLGHVGGQNDALACYRLVRSMVDASAAMWILSEHELLHAAPMFGPEIAAPQYLGQWRWASVIPETEIMLATELFAMLPVWIELPGFRAIHAAWDDERMRLLTSSLPGRRIPESLRSEESSRADFIRHAIALCTGATTETPHRPPPDTSPQPIPLFTAHDEITPGTIINDRGTWCSLGPIKGDPSRGILCYRWSGEERLTAKHLIEVR